ncbi:MAG: AAA family ATPase [Candidatus Reconcilbacillus cellulovorans]|uniref:AAA family ATPase n=1 Tax=Candidatus Reconcilbacillus cellulovorans TaxID=1906605 RepID=A0A2A6E3P7_9BACL|nr:MAG: AAA family ATPase [Candidatus Reconcilbacillus cellulovorans]
MNGRAADHEAIRSSGRISVILRQSEPAVPTGARVGSSGRETAATCREFRDIARELDELIGLYDVKQTMYEIFALAKVGKMRAEAGLQNRRQVYHMIFKGNPGTGKTTVARIVGKMFHQLGLLSRGHLLEVERADLVGEYIGHTALKTREWIRKAIGGVLFVDEAYSLARGGEKDFGREAIDALVKATEDYKDQFILILAGYSDEMDLFLSVNPGLPSRFPVQIEFPDYTVDELVQIAERLAHEREYVLSPQAAAKLRQLIATEIETHAYAFSNARFVRNVIERAIRKQAVRLLNQYVRTPSREELMALRPDDLTPE